MCIRDRYLAQHQVEGPHRRHHHLQHAAVLLLDDRLHDHRTVNEQEHVELSLIHICLIDSLRGLTAAEDSLQTMRLDSIVRLLADKERMLTLVKNLQTALGQHIAAGKYLATYISPTASRCV